MNCVSDYNNIVISELLLVSCIETKNICVVMFPGPVPVCRIGIPRYEMESVEAFDFGPRGCK